MIYIVYAFAAFALAWIVGQSKISLGFRRWLATGGVVAKFNLAMIECVGCLGVHLGWLAWLAGVRLTHFDPWWLDMGVLALCTCTSNLIIGRFVGVVD